MVNSQTYATSLGPFFFTLNITTMDLEIKEIKAKKPKARCNVCGIKKEIKFLGFHPDDPDIYIYICDDECKRQFEHHLENNPRRVRYFLDRIYYVNHIIIL